MERGDRLMFWKAYFRWWEGKEHEEDGRDRRFGKRERAKLNNKY